MDFLKEKISGIEISTNNKSKRIINIKIKEESLDKLVFPFNKFNILALEYKPFTRFTIAKSLDELFTNKLSKLIHSILTDRNTGCFIVAPEIINKKFDDTFLIKLSTALAHLVGVANFDDMASKYYARFFVKHEDSSDSYLRKAYTNMDLHTDGTYVKEKTDVQLYIQHFYFWVNSKQNFFFPPDHLKVLCNVPNRPDVTLHFLLLWHFFPLI